jgi:hypothetical protein
MQAMDWLLPCLVIVIGLFTAAFVMWRLTTWAFPRRKRRPGAMSRGRIVWLLLGGLSVILLGCLDVSAMWHNGEPPGDFVLKFGPFFVVAWGAAEIAIALRAAFRLRRPA